MHAATLRSGARFASTSAQAVAKSSSSAEVVAARLRKAQGQRVEPLIGLYHDSSRFPGHSNQELIDYIDNQLLFTVHPDHRSTPRPLQQASRHNAGLPPTTDGWYSYQVDQVTKAESVSRWRQVTDTLCGTVKGGQAGLATVEEMWQDIASIDAAGSSSPSSVGLSKEQDLEQSDLDGEGAEVGRETGGGRDPESQHDPQPKKGKKSEAGKEADSDASALDGEGYEVGRPQGGGKPE